MAQAQSIVIESEVFSNAQQAAEEFQAEADARSLVIETERLLKPSAGTGARQEPAARSAGVSVTAVSNNPKARVLSTEEILRVNESLRRAIEQSRRLKEAKRRADEELMALRQEKDLAENQMFSMESRLREYEQRLEQSDRLKSEYDRAVTALQQQFEERLRNLQAHIELMQQEIEGRVAAEAQQTAMDLGAQAQTAVEEGYTVLPVEAVMADQPLMKAPFLTRQPDRGRIEAVRPEVEVNGPASLPRPHFSILEAQRKGLDVMDLLHYLDEARKEMRGDEAEIFYNMGRLYFYQGKYAEAAVHYRRALELEPAVANAHFNLAYISGEFLRDYETALEHYHRYLHLSPGAEDEPLVREKILELRLLLSAGMRTAQEKEVRQDKRMRGYNW